MTSRTRTTLKLPIGDGWIVGDLECSGQVGELAVVAFHGLGSKRDGEKNRALAAECERRGWTFAAFDFRGHGESSGSLDQLLGSRLLNDIVQIRSELLNRGVLKFALVGSSMGAWAAAWSAIRYPTAVSSLVLFAPALRFLDRRWDRCTPEEQEQWRTAGRLKFKNDWVDTEFTYELVAERSKFPYSNLLTEWSTPTLIVHGMNDTIVSAEDSIEFVKQVRCDQVDLLLMKSADHRLSGLADVAARLACDFITRNP